MDKFTSKTVQGNGEKTEATADTQENIAERDQKEVNPQNNTLETSGTVNPNMPFIYQKIEGIFISQGGIQELERGEVRTYAREKLIKSLKRIKNQDIEEISNKFNELNKTSGIVNPIPSLIKQKLEELFLLNERILEIEGRAEIDRKSKESMIENLDNSKDKLMDQLIKEVSGKFNELEQQKKTLRSMEEVRQVKNTRQNPSSPRAYPLSQKAESNPGSQRE
ncbi:hypothetical protein ACTXLQ_07880 [Enterococcus hirae]|uniref:hypothetical protein n=1 Tax=Enterococcus hirae TaxID=1354 RepID=UPI0019DBD935|nr:hypothetical protein [Enterococcus hirae]